MDTPSEQNPVNVSQETPPSPPARNPMAATPSLARIVVISLAVLTAGLAIAYGGFYFGQRTSKVPSSYPTPSVHPSPAATATPTPEGLDIMNPTLMPDTKRYTDATYGYRVDYPTTGWIFRRTYGPDIQKLAPTDILSGFDLTYNALINGQPMTQATIVVNVLDSHDYTDIEKWIDAYDLNYPKNADKSNTTFQGYAALKYVDRDSAQKATEYLYFLAGKYAYRITYWEQPVIRNATRDIVNSFQP